MVDVGDGHTPCFGPLCEVWRNTRWISWLPSKILLIGFLEPFVFWTEVITAPLSLWGERCDLEIRSHSAVEDHVLMKGVFVGMISSIWWIEALSESATVSLRGPL